MLDHMVGTWLAEPADRAHERTIIAGYYGTFGQTRVLCLRYMRALVPFPLIFTLERALRIAKSA